MLLNVWNELNIPNVWKVEKERQDQGQMHPHYLNVNYSLKWFSWKILYQTVLQQAMFVTASKLGRNKRLVYIDLDIYLHA